MANRRIFISGICGCLGSNLVEHLIPQGYEIVGIDNYSTGDRKFQSTHSNLKILEGSVQDRGFVGKIFEDFRPEVIIHSAAFYKDPKDCQEDVDTNIGGAICMSDLASQYEVKHLINFQTALCYGRPSKTPIPIEADTRPFTSYGISKTAGEAYLLNSGVSVTSLRLANICGPRLSIGPIPTFYKRLKADLECFCTDSTRDFLDVSDFNALIDLLLSTAGPDSNQVLNVSTGESTSILQIYELIASHLGVSSEGVPVVPVGGDDVQHVILDPSETESKLGWKARFDFKTTLARQLEWYDDNGIENIYSHLTDKG